MDTSKMPQLTLTLIRGLPGSGKSTLACKLVSDSCHDLVHLEADMYFIDKDGIYEFNPTLLNEAHKWCQQQCEQYLKQKKDVVVANTFIKQWEMKAYKSLAKQYNAVLHIEVCKGNYINIHNVPLTTINNMRRAWQD